MIVKMLSTLYYVVYPTLFQIAIGILKNMKTESFLWGDVTKTSFPILHSDISCTWLIIGGGIAGLSVAHYLLEAGESDIVIIEKNTIGSGSTGYSAGMLVYEPEQAPWSLYIKKYGRKLAKTYIDSQLEALSLVQTIIKKEKISCDFEKEYYLDLANSKPELLEVLKNSQARKELAQQTVTVQKEQLSEGLQSAGYIHAEKIFNEVSVNPLKFARGFANVLKNRGVRIYEKTQLLHSKKGVVTTSSGTITYGQTFSCLGTSDTASDIKKYVTSICVTRKLTRTELKNIGLTEKTMFIDDYKNSFFYGKVTADRRILFGYGDVLLTTNKVPNPYRPHIKQITQFTKKHFPIALPFTHAWSAAYALSKKDIPVVKKTSYGFRINGGGTQISTMVAAGYAVSIALKKKHPLTNLFEK